MTVNQPILSLGDPCADRPVRRGAHSALADSDSRAERRDCARGYWGRVGYSLRSGQSRTPAGASPPQPPATGRLA